MPTCIYCGESAGMFRKAHKQCREKHAMGRAHIASMVTDAARGKSPISELPSRVSHTARTHYLDSSSLVGSVVQGWEVAVNVALDDDILTDNEEKQLDEVAEVLDLNQNDLDRNGYFTKLVQAGILRDLAQGKTPQQVDISGDLPFNFQKSEDLMWVFQNVHYYELRTKRQYVGGSSSVSVRIAKGVYVRTGAFRGNPVETSEQTYIDSGLLGVTTKHIYFAGEMKTFRVPYRKIVSFQPYEDGLGIQRDAMTAKPQTFVMDDGWFVYNLVSILANEQG